MAPKDKNLQNPQLLPGDTVNQSNQVLDNNGQVGQNPPVGEDLRTFIVYNLKPKTNGVLDNGQTPTLANETELKALREKLAEEQLQLLKDRQKLLDQLRAEEEKIKLAYKPPVPTAEEAARIATAQQLRGLGNEAEDNFVAMTAELQAQSLQSAPKKIYVGNSNKSLDELTQKEAVALLHSLNPQELDALVKGTGDKGAQAHLDAYKRLSGRQSQEVDTFKAANGGKTPREFLEDLEAQKKAALDKKIAEDPAHKKLTENLNANTEKLTQKQTELDGVKKQLTPPVPAPKENTPPELEYKHNSNAEPAKHVSPDKPADPTKHLDNPLKVFILATAANKGKNLTEEELDRVHNTMVYKNPQTDKVELYPSFEAYTAAVAKVETLKGQLAEAKKYEAAQQSVRDIDQVERAAYKDMQTAYNEFKDAAYNNTGLPDTKLLELRKAAVDASKKAVDSTTASDEKNKDPKNAEDAKAGLAHAQAELDKIGTPKLHGAALLDSLTKLNKIAQGGYNHGPDDMYARKGNHYTDSSAKPEQLLVLAKAAKELQDRNGKVPTPGELESYIKQQDKNGKLTYAQADARLLFYGDKPINQNDIQALLDHNKEYCDYCEKMVGKKAGIDAASGKWSAEFKKKNEAEAKANLDPNAKPKKTAKELEDELTAAKKAEDEAKAAFSSSVEGHLGVGMTPGAPAKVVGGTVKVKFQDKDGKNVEETFKLGVENGKLVLQDMGTGKTVSPDALKEKGIKAGAEIIAEKDAVVNNVKLDEKNKLTFNEDLTIKMPTGIPALPAGGPGVTAR